MTTTKKAAPKKAAKVKPLKTYAGYGIARTATRVKFGCGSVSISKRDLRIMSALVLDREAVTVFRGLGLDNYRTAQGFLIPDIKGKVNTQTLRAIGAAMIDYPVYFGAISRVKSAVGTRQTINHLLAVPAQTYLEIIGN